jgi:DNA modification methylase
MKQIKEFTNKLFHDKWENILPQIPDNSIDIVITSPPYNVNLGNNKFKKDSYDNYDDNLPYTKYLNWMNTLFIECYRILKKGGRICINIGDKNQSKITTHVDFILKMKQIGFLMLCPIIWNKKQIGNRTAWGSYKSPSMPCFPTPFEYIIVMCKESLRHEGDPQKITVSGKEFQKNANALWEFPPDTSMMKKWQHPATFPEELPKRLIQQLTYADDIVLDPFSGSGTTCVVAKKLKRKYIGIEQSPKHHQTSLTRLNNTPVLITKKNEINNKIQEMSTLDWIE